MAPEFPARGLFKLTCLGVLFLAGCRPTGIEPPEATLTSYPTSTSTPSPTETETSSPTDSPEPTATPEWPTADPNAIETWPTWAQEYFANPDNATDAQDRRFDQFLTDGRRYYFERLGQIDPEKLRTLLDFLVQGSVLTTATLEEVAAMGQGNMLTTLRTIFESDLRQDFLPRRRMLWLNLINNAVEKRSTILSPNEIRQIVADRDGYFIPWVGLLPDAPEEHAKYVVQYGFGDQRNLGQIVDGRFPVYDDFHLEIYGKEIQNPIRILLYPGLIGDIAGLVELPRQDGYAFLMRVRNKQGQPFLHVFYLEQSGLKFEPGDETCFGSPQSGAAVDFMECLPQLSGDVSRFAVFPQGGYRSNWHPLTPETIQEWLMWPPTFSLHDVTEQVGSGLTIYVLHHQTMLIVARQLQIYPHDEHQNQP